MFNKIVGMICRFLINKVDDSNPLQILKIEGHTETIDGVERLQNYGMTSHPPKNSEAVGVSVRGVKGDQVVLVVDSADHRITNLNTGEVCIYSQFGANILLNSNGEVEIAGNSDYAVGFNELKSAVEELKAWLNGHTHPAPGGSTSAPSPVYTGNIDSAKVDMVRLP